MDGPPVDIILLQDHPFSKGFLPGFSDLKSFAPTVGRPKVACYVSRKFLQCFTVLPILFPESDNSIALEVYTPHGGFGSTFCRFRIGNVYARPINHPSRSVSPETSFVNSGFPYLVAGDFHIHNPAVDPFSILPSSEELESAPYFNNATNCGFSLLNTPGIYTRFPFSTLHRPRAIDLAFANPPLFPAFRQWDATYHPSIGSDHVLNLISLQPPAPELPLPRPKWGDTDWPVLENTLEGWGVRPPPKDLLPNH